MTAQREEAILLLKHWFQKMSAAQGNEMFGQVPVASEIEKVKGDAKEK